MNVLKQQDRSSAKLSFVEKGNEGSKDELIVSQKEYQSLKYAKTFNENADIIVTPMDTGVKEEIVLYAIPEETEFSYELKVQNVVPLLREDGNVYFVDLRKGIIVAAIAAPFMYDSAEEFVESYDIKVKLEKINDNKYEYTLIPDRAFLEDENTVYPVVIDPSVNTASGTIVDTFIAQRYSTRNYANDAALKIGYTPSTFYISRGLIKIASFPDEMDGYTITDADFHAYENYVGSSSPTMEVHKIKEGWKSTTVTWATRPDFDSESLADNMVTSVGWYSWDITNLAREWHDGTTPNYGIVIKNDNESLNMYKRFNSHQSTTNKDYFSFTYTDTLPPNQVAAPTVTVTKGAINSGIYSSIVVSYNPVTDRPSGSVARYELLMSTSSTTNFIDQNLNPVNNTFTKTNLADNKTYRFKIRAYDSYGNYSDSNYSTAISCDRTPPTIDAEDIRLSTTWTNNNSLTVNWENIYDQGPNPDVPSELKFRFNDTGSWGQACSYSSPGQKTVDCSSVSEGQNNLNVIVYDPDGNYRTKTFSFTKDCTDPAVSITLPDDEDVIPISGNMTYDISASVNDANLASWKIDYALGVNPLESGFTGNVIASGTNELASTSYKTWDLPTLLDSRMYTLRLTATDKAGNSKEVRVKVLYALDTDEVTPYLSLMLMSGTDDIDPDDDIMVDNVDVKYGLATGGPATGMLGTLYANDEQVDAQTAQDMDLDFDPLALEYDTITDKWVWAYPEGSQVFLRVEAEDTATGDYNYTDTHYEGHKISDTFDDSDGVTLTNTTLSGSKIQLSPNQLSGSVQSEQVINGRVSYVTLTVDEDKPINTNITYSLRYGEGENDYVTLTPNEKIILDIPINKCYLKAEMSSQSAGSTPTLNSWHLDTMYVAFGDSVVIENSFLDNARGFCELNNTVHDEDAEGIKLSGTMYPSVSFNTLGSVESTLRITPGDVWEIFLSVEEDKPAGTNITYQISTNNGTTWSEDLTTGTNPNLEGEEYQWILIEGLRNEDDTLDMVNGNHIILRAKLSGDGTATPTLKSWTLKCRQTLAGEAHDVVLIDSPDNLSTLVDANYMTLLRWEASETPGVTYNIYRSKNPYDPPSDATLLEEGITETYWNDFNLDYGERFYYRVVAVKTYNINGTDYLRFSAPSNEVFADTVSANELDKKLGLQNYWSYSGFQTAGGTGYVNVANGNLVYKATDMVVSGPFYATVLSRTLNSTGKSKTPLGYGWDFSFNTCLLKEYDAAGTNVIALILKDGDGSFHRFEGNDIDGYTGAKGTFMELEYDSANNVYTIERKDGITYYFNANTMKLDQFEDLNGQLLSFEYDVRGNVSAIENTGGERVELIYFVETPVGTVTTEEIGMVLNSDGSTSSHIVYITDSIYANKFVDMLASVTWIGDGQGIKYSYSYDEEDRLQEVSYISGSVVDEDVTGDTKVVESYQYNVNLDEDAHTEDNNVVITDAEGGITVVEFDDAGRVVNAYEQVSALSDYDTADNFAFNYDTTNYVTTVTNNYGVGVEYAYEANSGLILSKTDAMNNTITYAYEDPNPANDYLVTSVSYENARTNSSPVTTVKSVYTYDSYGNVTGISTLSKEDGGSFVEIGSETTLTYDSRFKNKVESVKVEDVNDPTNHTFTFYTYDSNGNIKTETVADDELESNRDIEKTTQYDYYSGEDEGLAWQLKSVKDEYGKETRYIYDTTNNNGIINGTVIHVQEFDPNGNYVRTLSTYEYDALGQTSSVSEVYYDDPNVTETPNVTRMTYDEFGRLKQIVNLDGTSEIWEYDDTGRLKMYQVGVMNGTQFNMENQTWYTYDLIGRLKTTEIDNDPDDSNDNVITEVDYLKWDSDNNTSTGDTSGNDADKIVTTVAKDTDDERISIEYYDIVGRLVEAKIYDGTTFVTTGTYTYDKIGNMIEFKDNADRVTRAYYDALNRQTSTVVDPFDLPGTDNVNIETQYKYDYLGNKTKVTQVSYASEEEQTSTDYIIDDQYVTNYEYDDLSRLTKVTQANPSYDPTSPTDPADPDYDSDKVLQNLVTSYYYDELVAGGTQVMNYTVDPRGYVNETYFDLMGYKVKSFNGANTGDGDDDNFDYIQTLFEYDLSEDIRGVVTKVTRTDGTFEKYDYDIMSRKTTVAYFGSTVMTPDMTLDTGNYSQLIKYEYDNMGRVDTETIWDAKNEYTHRTQYDYDKMGRTYSVWDGTWDSLVPNPDVETSDGLDVEYTYNSAGDLTNLNYATSVTGEVHDLHYLYDGYGRNSEIQLDPTEAQTPGDNTVRKYFYDTVTGELTHTQDFREFADNLTDYIQTDYVYNSASMLKEITYTDAGLGTNDENITERYTYTYDGRGYVIGEKLETDYSTTDPMKTVYKTYEYDSLGRLVNAAYGAEQQTSWNDWTNWTQYTYDIVGNRKTMDAKSTDEENNVTTNAFEYNYSQFNQLEEVIKNSETQETYGYDLRGNQTARYEEYDIQGDPTAATVYAYDLLNRLNSIATPDDVTEINKNLTMVSENIYNVSGQRINKTDHYEDELGNPYSSTEKYFYSGGAILYTQTGTGILNTMNIIDLGGSIVASKRFDDDNNPNTFNQWQDQYFFYHYDMRGSTTAIVKPNGESVQEYTYDEFGNISATGSFYNEVTFTGSISDTSTGLQYMNARYYEPTTGRFITQDSYTGNVYEPWTQHLYSYCGNNPTNFIDPTGHMRHDPHKGTIPYNGPIGTPEWLDDIVHEAGGQTGSGGSNGGNDGGSDGGSNSSNVTDELVDYAIDAFGDGLTVYNGIDYFTEGTTTVVGDGLGKALFMWKLVRFQKSALNRQDALVSNLWNVGEDEYRKRNKLVRESYNVYLMSNFSYDEDFKAIASSFHSTANNLYDCKGNYYEDLSDDVKRNLNHTVLRGCYGGVNWKESVMPEIAGVLYDAVMAVYRPF